MVATSKGGVIIDFIPNRLYSYGELCDYFNEPKYGGNQKLKQIKEWNKIVKLVKCGKKYEIERIRNKSEIEEYKLQTTYKELLKTLMYSYLSALDQNSLTITIPKLMEKMYLVNKNYSYGKYNTVEVYEVMIDSLVSKSYEKLPTLNDVDRFFISTETNYRNKIKSMLKDMEEEALISHPYEWLCFGRTHGKYTRIERATKDEYERFLNIQTEELKKFISAETNSPKNKSELTKQERYRFYCDILKNAKSQFNCSFYSYEYEIVLNRHGISEHLSRNIEKLQNSINSKVVAQLLARDNYLCLIDWFIEKDPKVNVAKLLKENRNKGE